MPSAVKGAGKTRKGEVIDSFDSFVRLTLSEDALYGLAGDVVRTLAPHTEADPAGLLMSFLVMLGNACGPGPALDVGADSHPGRLFAILVGDTSTGRKGTAGSEIERLFHLALPEYTETRYVRGIQSAEAVIKQASGGRDPRLLLQEHEFGRLLITISHRPNLSSTLKEAWDGRPLSVVTKRQTLKAGASHISVLGHVTGVELADRLTSVEISSGFANRFLFVMVNRSKLLPRGGSLSQETLEELAGRIEDVVDFAREFSLGRLDPISRELCAYHGVYPSVPLQRTDAFWKRWDELYSGEFEKRPPGIAGVVTSRVAVQVLRLAAVFALSDMTDTVDVRHLNAAVAVWDYCERSVRAIFGTISGNRDADRVLRALHEGPLSRTDISVLFRRNKSARQLDEIIGAVTATGLVVAYREGEGVRARDMFALKPQEEKEKGNANRRREGTDQRPGAPAAGPGGGTSA